MESSPASFTPCPTLPTRPPTVHLPSSDPYHYGHYQYSTYAPGPNHHTASPIFPPSSPSSRPYHHPHHYTPSPTTPERSTLNPYPYTTLWHPKKPAKVCRSRGTWNKLGSCIGAVSMLLLCAGVPIYLRFMGGSEGRAGGNSTNDSNRR